MRKIIALAMAAVAVTACSKSEVGPDNNTPSDKLNILTTISTRAVVEGATLPQGSAIGVHVTQGTAGDLKAYVGLNFASGGKNLESGQNVRFDNKADASKWVSQDASDQANFLMIGGETGTVYAYYPYTATVSGLGDAATIPVTIQQTGDIDLTAAPTAGAAYLNADENDYLYYKPDASGRKTVSSSTTTTAPLSMSHAMARLSFRIYISKDAPELTVADNGSEDYILTGYAIKNKNGKDLLCANNTNVTMTIATGSITSTDAKGGQIKRTIKQGANTGYALTRVAGSDATEDEKNALVWVSNLVLPIASIPSSTVNSKTVSNDLELVFEIQKGTTGTKDPYTVPLTVIAGQSDKWEAGSNYQYTIKVNSALALSVETVTVAPWTNVVGGDITIE